MIVVRVAKRRGINPPCMISRFEGGTAPLKIVKNGHVQVHSGTIWSPIPRTLSSHQVNCKYWSVWVAFLYTFVLRFQLSCKCMLMSRYGSDWSISSSYVNWSQWCRKQGAKGGLAPNNLSGGQYIVSPPPQYCFQLSKNEQMYREKTPQKCHQIAPLFT